MAFDKNHHLLQPQDDEFVGVNASPIFTLDQVKQGSTGVGVRTAASRTRRVASAGSGTTRVTTAQLNEQCAAQRYEYFKSNRQTLPPTIAKHAGEIDELIKTGRSAEDAFGEVLKKYF